MDINDLAYHVKGWAKARNIIGGSDAKAQTLKTISEFGEMAEGIRDGKEEEILDGIGDTLVTIIIVCAQLDIEFADIMMEVDADEDLGYDDMSNVCEAAVHLGEMADSVLKNDIQRYFQNAARVVSVLEAIAENYHWTLDECLDAAFDQIKDRRGVMYNGAFIRDTDARYEDVRRELGLVDEAIMMPGPATDPAPTAPDETAPPAHEARAGSFDGAGASANYEPEAAPVSAAAFASLSTEHGPEAADVSSFSTSDSSPRARP